MKKQHIVVAVIAALLLAACSENPDAASEASADWVMDRVESLDPLAVEGTVATPQILVDDIAASGLIRGEREVNLVAEAQGVIQSVGFELGDRVTAGQVLVRLDTSIQLLAVEEARESARSAELDVAATERLVNTGNASQSTLSQARSLLAGARARFAQAQKSLDDRTLTAPFDGLVANKDLSVEEGGFLNIGTPVARIISMDTLEVRLSVGEREVRYLEPGAPAFVSASDSFGQEIEATVAAIAAGSDPQTGSFPVIVRWDNPESSMTRAGMSVAVRIPPVGAARSIVIPANAVVSRGEERAVFVARPEGIAERRIVELGTRTGDRQAILAGIQEGEMVVISGLRSLSDGDPVQVTERTVLAGGRQ